MKIFLTGGSGFIGKNYMELALKKKHKLYVITRKSRKNKKNLIWLKGNIKQNWKELKKCDVLVHLAATGVSNQNLSLQKCFNYNVREPLILLLNSLKLGCRNWLIVGTSSEFGESLRKKKKLSINSKRIPNNNYGLSKYIFSEIVFCLTKKFNINCRYARIFPVYGEDDKENKLYNSLKISMKSKKKFLVKKPDEIRDYLCVKTVAKKLLEMTNFKSYSGGLEKWHIANGKPQKISQFILSKISKSDINRIIFSKKKIINEHHISNNKSIWF